MPLYKHLPKLDETLFRAGQAIYVAQQLSTHFIRPRWSKFQPNTLLSISAIKHYFLLFSLKVYFEFIPFHPSRISLNNRDIKKIIGYFRNRLQFGNNKDRLVSTEDQPKPTLTGDWKVPEPHKERIPFPLIIMAALHAIFIAVNIIYHAINLANSFKELLSSHQTTSIPKKLANLTLFYFKLTSHSTQMISLSHVILTTPLLNLPIYYRHLLQKFSSPYYLLKSMTVAFIFSFFIPPNKALLNQTPKKTRLTQSILLSAFLTAQALADSTYLYFNFSNIVKNAIYTLKVIFGARTEVEYTAPIVPKIERSLSVEKIDLALDLGKLLTDINKNTAELILRKCHINLLQLPDFKKLLDTIAGPKISINKLDISENELGLATDAHIEALASFIQSIKTVSTLVFSENKLDKLSTEPVSTEQDGFSMSPFKKLLTAILSNPHITTLDISLNNMGHFNQEQLSIFTELLARSKITQLNLGKNNLSFLSTKLFKELMNCLSLHESLTFMDFSGNEFHALSYVKYYRLSELIQKNKILLHLSLASNGLGKNQRNLALMPYAFTENSTLQSIDLSWNELEKLDYYLVTDFLSFMKIERMQSIDLRGNSLALLPEPSFQQLISDMDNPSITSWNLADNKMGKLSESLFKAWATVFINHKKILNLNLSGNALGEVKAESFDDIIDMIQENDQLLTLDLSDNLLNAQPTNLVRLLNAISQHPSLRSVNLANNQLGLLNNVQSIGLAELIANNQLGLLNNVQSIGLAELIANNINLEYLDISGNSLKSQGDLIDSIIKVVRAHPSLIELKYDDETFEKVINNNFMQRYTALSNYCINELKIANVMVPIIIQYLGGRAVDPNISFKVKNPEFKRERSKSTVSPVAVNTTIETQVLFCNTKKTLSAPSSSRPD